MSSARDRETRERLMAAAARLFADRGFKRVTVREICREARANVAAVNYHFGDKLGLYREVLQSAVATMRSTLDAARAAGKQGAPEDKIRAYVRVYLTRLVGSGSDAWIHRLMWRELVDSTPALDVIVEQAIRPRMLYLRGLVAELLRCPADDERAARCAHSIHALCTALVPNPVAARLYPDFKRTPKAIAALSEQIALFSIGGVHALRPARPGRKGAGHYNDRIA